MCSGCWAAIMVMAGVVVGDAEIVLVRYEVACGETAAGGWDVLGCDVVWGASGIGLGSVGGSVGGVGSLVPLSGDVRVSVGSVWVGVVRRK